MEGLRRSPADASPRLKLNSVLNSVTRRGPFLGNSAGVIAMVYNGVNSTIGYYRGRHDSANSVVAGAISGMLFKSTRGVRPMLISGGLVAGAAGAWAVSPIPGAKSPCVLGADNVGDLAYEKNALRIVGKGLNVDGLRRPTLAPTNLLKPYYLKARKSPKLSDLRMRKAHVQYIPTSLRVLYWWAMHGKA